MNAADLATSPNVKVEEPISVGHSESIDRLSKGLNAAVVLLTCVGFVWIASRSLDVPGVYYDEVLQAVPAMRLSGVEVNGTVVQVEGSVFDIAGRPYPLLILTYLGSLQMLALAIAFELFGTSVTIMRGTFIALGTLALLFTYLFTRRLFDDLSALLATIFLALDPSFIFAVRSDNGPTAIMMICKMAALWMLLLWWQTGRRSALWVGALVCGVGVYDKVNFVWFLGALAVAVIVLYPRGLLTRLRATPLPVLVGAACAMVGASVQVAYTVATRGGPLRGVTDLASHDTALGTNNLSILQNLVTRFETYLDLVGGYRILDVYLSTDSGGLEYVRTPFASTLMPLLLTVAILAIVGRAWLGLPVEVNVRKSAFLLLLPGLILVFSVVSPTNLIYHHVLLAFPFHILLISHVLAELQRLRLGHSGQLRSSTLEVLARRAGVMAAALLVVAALTFNASVVSRHYRVLNQTGGIGMWSDSAKELTNQLEARDQPVACMDWGICLNVLFLSEGNVAALDHWQQYLYTTGSSAELASMFAEQDTLYVFHTPEHSGIQQVFGFDGPRMTFFATAAEEHVRVLPVAIIRQRNGEAIFEVYAVQHSGRPPLEGARTIVSFARRSQHHP